MALNIKRQLKKLGKSQAWLATELDVSPGYVSELISGKKSPSHKLLLEMALALQIDPSGLFGSDREARNAFVHGVHKSLRETQVEDTDRDDGNASGDLRAIVDGSNLEDAKLYATTEHLPNFMILAGDHILVELSREPQPGNLVVIDAKTHKKFSGLPNIARWTGETFVLGSVGMDTISASDAKVIGVVRSVYRSL
jgi:transcriptional regulator with XRE-family HTH domain